MAKSNKNGDAIYAAKLLSIENSRSMSANEGRCQTRETWLQGFHMKKSSRDLRSKD